MKTVWIKVVPLNDPAIRGNWIDTGVAEQIPKSWAASVAIFKNYAPMGYRVVAIKRRSVGQMETGRAVVKIAIIAAVAFLAYSTLTRRNTDDATSAATPSASAATINTPSLQTPAHSAAATTITPGAYTLVKCVSWRTNGGPLQAECQPLLKSVSIETCRSQRDSIQKVLDDANARGPGTFEAKCVEPMPKFQEIQ
jgi:hypothetical protein